MRTLWRFLTSRNTAVVLLIAVSAVLLIGAALPNPSLMPPDAVEEMRRNSPLLLVIGENFNSMKVGRSYVFGLTGMLLIVSTTFCSIDRVIRKIKTESAGRAERPTEGRDITVCIPGPLEEFETKLISMLRGKHWRASAYDEGDARVIAFRKGDHGFWGSIFFHAILVTLIAGVAVYYLSAFYATLKITEGQEMRLSKENLERIDRVPLVWTGLPELVFRFNKFSSEYYEDRSATDYTADFDIADLRTGGQWKQVFKINEPLRYGGIDFLMNMQGYSPNFILYKNGVPVEDTIVSLDFDQNYRDSFDMRKERMRVVTQFFPDMARNPDGTVYTRTFRPKNPYFGLEIFQDGNKVFRGLVGKGEGVDFGPYRIVFSDLRHWITISLVKETGLGFFFFCAMIGLAGIFVRVIDPERRITVSIQDTCEEKIATFRYSGKHFEGMLKEEVEEIIRVVGNAAEGTGSQG